MLHRDANKESGTSMLEYMFLLALICVVCLAGIARIGTVTNDNMNASVLGSAMGGG